MSDDWRVTVSFADEVLGSRLVRSIGELKLEKEAVAKLGERVSVSQDGPHVYLYTNSEERAQEAQQLVRSTLKADQVKAQFSLKRWHPIEETWEDASKPLPETGVEVAQEHQHLDQREANESEQRGAPEWEIRVQLPSHKEATALAHRLEREGIPSVRHWKYLLLGALNEEQAQQLAARLQREVQDGEIKVEGTLASVRSTLPANPFAVFGGIGG